jgi:L-serine dehydratase
MSSTLPPSIFNDVLGPVMRGPSSSHSAASVRIARLARDLAGGHVDHAIIEFDPDGSLATTHETQGSDIGLFGGLLGWDADDPRLPHSRDALAEHNVQVDIVVRDIGATHPNTYRLTVTNRTLDTTHVLEADSLGGGMIVVNRIDGIDVELFGDQAAQVFGGPDGALEVRIGETDATPAPTGATWQRQLAPVLPVPTPPGLQLPFSSVAEMIAEIDPTTRPLSRWALDYECARGGLSESEVLAQMSRIRDIMRASIDAGLKGTDWGDRILGNQSAGYRAALENGQLLEGGMLNRMVLYVTALMEAKSAMEVIVAAPTAGSCGLFPGTCLAAAETLDLDDALVLRALLSGGLIGVFVALRSSFAAEVGGCQAETGAGASMAAAALVEMMGGNAAQSLSAASMALQNVLGLVCDPVANRVEAPCLGRNVAGASNAFVSANMALAGYDALIPFDEVLDAHREISQSMPRELRCTALGGLSTTPTSKAIEQRMRGGGGCGGCAT